MFLMNSEVGVGLLCDSGNICLAGDTFSYFEARSEGEQIRAAPVCYKNIQVQEKQS